jgi:Sec-independent protein secretion pathway component TatC
MAVFAAVITPTPDAMTMMFLWVPMGFLYELGIILCALQRRTPFEEVETPETEEMVEV